MQQSIVASPCSRSFGRPLVVSSVFVALALGCADAAVESEDVSPPADTAEQDDELRRRAYWRRHVPSARDVPDSSTGGSSSTGGPSDNASGCEVCTKAVACCNAVGGGHLCTHSETTCESLESTAQAAYVSACRMLIETVKDARTSPPAACR